MKAVEMMFRFSLDDSSMNGAKNFVDELNQSMWTDYLTGLSAGLSMRNRHLVMSAALDEHAILNDGKDISEFVLFVASVAKKHHACKVIDFADLSDLEQSEVFAGFLRCDMIQSFLPGDDAGKAFELFFHLKRQHAK